MVIQIQDLNKKYPRGPWALQDLTIEIKPGLTGLLGPNGAGKTTLMKILATILLPTSGNVLVNDWSLAEFPERMRQSLGYLPQETGYFKRLTGYEFLDWVGIIKGIEEPTKRRNQILELIEEVNLGDVAKRQIKSYSGGMKRRLGIAQALLGEPEIIIIDEPTAGLDPEERVRFRNLLARRAREKVVIFSTHIVADIEDSCDQVGVLKDGQLVYFGSLDELAYKARGMVWQLEIPLHEFREGNLEKKGFRVVNARKQGNAFLIRLLAKKQPEGAISLPATLEDGYLALIGGMAV